MQSINKTFLIYGVSQGLGKAIATFAADSNDLIYGISRSEPQLSRNIQWIKADLAQPVEACADIKNVIENDQLDVFIYL